MEVRVLSGVLCYTAYMNIGALRKMIEELPDNMEFFVAYADKALHVAGMGTAQLGTPANFVGNGTALVNGLTVFEITARDQP